jgi:transposase
MRGTREAGEPRWQTERRGEILFADGTGICLFYKRLDRRVFRVPDALAPGARHVELDECLLDALLDGVDLTDAPKRSPRPRGRIH